MHFSRISRSVLNDCFLSATNQFRQKPVQLTGNQEAARLYRHGLRRLLSWTIDREIFYEEVAQLRARFDLNKGCSDAKQSLLLEEGKAELFEFTHPDPYCVPCMPGGSMFMRNPPPPLEICFPDGNYPADASKVTLNPDWSICSPETGRNATGTVLVDFTKKNME